MRRKRARFFAAGGRGAAGGEVGVREEGTTEKRVGGGVEKKKKKRRARSNRGPVVLAFLKGRAFGKRSVLCKRMRETEAKREGGERGEVV